MGLMENNINILIIEDNPDYAALIKGMLNRGGVSSVTIAETIERGVSFVKEQSFDIILTDLSLPDSGESDSLNIMIEASGERVPVIVITGKSDRGDSFIGKGAQDYLIKGEFSSSELIRSINYAIERNGLINNVKEMGEYYKELFEAYGAVKLIVDPADGSIVDANRAAVSFYGWSKDELLRMSIFEINILTPEKIKEEMENAKHNRRNYFCFRHRIKDGSIRDVAVYSNMVEFRGKVLLHSIIHDDTERVKGDLTLKENYNLLKIAGDITRFGGWQVDLAENRVYWSNQVAELHEMPSGYSPLVEEGISFYAQEWRDKITEVFRDCAENGKPYDEVMEIITGKGNRIWVRTAGVPVRDEKGKIIKIQGAFQDITKIKKTEQDLRSLNLKYKAIVDNQPLAVCSWLPDTTITFSNRYYNEIIADGTDPLGKKWLDFVPEDSRGIIESYCADLVLKPEIVTYEHNVMCTGDSEIIFFWIDVPLLNENGELQEFLSCGYDITERVKAEKDKNEILARLEQTVDERTAELLGAYKEMEAFSYMASHELKAPLRHIKGFAKLLNDELGEKSSEKISHYLKVITGGANKMGRLIDYFIEYAKAGKSQLVSGPVNMKSLINDVIRDYKKDIIDRGVEVKIGNLPSLRGDKKLLKTVVDNLISNALKFTGSSENPCIEIWGEKRAAGLEYFFKDNGSGFDMKRSDKIFQLWQRLSHDHDYEGTGIGLSIVEKIISRHGGEVKASGEPGKGALFSFIIPDRGINE